MKATFKSERYFYSQNMWFIRLRPGDENHHLLNGFKIVNYKFEDNRPIAGPFKTKRRMLAWLNSFIAMYGKRRNMPSDYIPDFIANNIGNY